MQGNIAISGLTAAGKTTHARLLEIEFGLKYVSGSSILLDRGGVGRQVPPDFWISPSGMHLVSRIVELEVDEALRDAEASSAETVFDCRSLAWLARNPILTIWLESSRDSRIRKAIVSLGRRSELTEKEIAAEVDRKDASDRANLIARYGFDLFTDREPFDLVLDITDLITAPTRVASWRSIREAHDVISSVAGLYLLGDDLFRRRLHQARTELGARVFRRLSPRLLEMLDA